MSRTWIGIDTGGTFTDLVRVDFPSGIYRYHKLPTSADDPSLAILDGVRQILDETGPRCVNVECLVLGTTLATNAVLQGKCAASGMLTTEGFRDVIELARQRRPHYFNLDVLKPMPPAARDCRLEISGRIAADGTEVAPLDEGQLQSAVKTLKAKGVEAVAICFIHSYANPAHEARAAALVRRLWPEVYLCTSNEVLAEFREFERFATTAVNASLMPVMDRYLERFQNGVSGLGIRRAPRVMQSNGGAVSPDAVRRLPVNTFFSGPAGGVIGGAGLGKRLGIGNMITFDMGGTSTDVCLIRNYEPAKKSEREMGGFPVRTRTLDIHTIGAGGGSIAWVDAGGLLKVGPQSAGAYPGPAAYGRGGARPTVTDANVVLGRLNPESLLGGRMAVHPDRARAAVESELTQRLKITAVKAAAGIVEIINVNMMGAVRVISVEQGEDPREFTLVAFGGAGPLHAAEVARNMGIRNVLVPPRPGLLSAIGLLHAEVRGDFSLTKLLRAVPGNLKAFNRGLKDLKARGMSWLAGEGVQRAKFEWLADLRYFGQNFELILGLKDGRLNEIALTGLVNSFHRRHRRFYGYDMRGQPVEIVNLRLVVTATRRSPPHEDVADRRSNLKLAPVAERKVWFPETGFIATPIYDRAELPAQCRIAGPAIIEQMDTTTVVPRGASVRNDAHGYLHMDLGRLPQRGKPAWAVV